MRDNNCNTKLRFLIHAALDFQKKYYIKKFTIPRPHVYVNANNHTLFVELLNKLEKRELTGTAAITAVEKFLSECSINHSKWYARVLRKDLKIGCNISTANKAGFDVPKFDVQLAKDGKKCKKVNDIFKKGAYASPKFDGYRCLAVLEDGNVTLYSRNGTVYLNFPSVEKSIRDLWWDSKQNFKCVFDGEIMSDDFNSMQQSAFASTRGTTVGDVTFYIFDMIPFEEWSNNQFTTKASIRYNNLEFLFDMSRDKMSDLNINNIKMVPHKLITTMADINKLEQDYIKDGYEGVMVNPDIPYYKGKKSNKMLKFKTMLSMDCEVVEVYEGEKGKKFEGTLGGITVVQENGIKCNVGSGFNEIKGSWKERNMIWQNPEVILGRIVEIKYQELGSEGRMRFPIIVRYRNDKQ
ncbi:MAG: hypothetical protein HWN81_00360 [Candidatus Lokiarchaeota archaeon]|nr:hypothetical protein [Candidatus Lokiarchaeota archaeon]